MTNYAVDYLRLSKEDEREGESGSITNQRRRIQQYCSQNGLILVNEFVDDDYSGGNFNRPGFQAMIDFLKTNREISIVITKDLSRLGRDMTEVSYYTERYFPENGIRYLAIDDGFDSENDNMLAPFQYALNDMYIRDVSKKVKNSLHILMDNGKYCCAAPYGYKKDPCDVYHLIPDEGTAQVVKEIFQLAISGESSIKIAKILTKQGISPPSQTADEWNAITVRRILRNPVYLGHTVLGKTKKPSPKSDIRKLMPKEKWRVTKNTHEALITEEQRDIAEKNLANLRSDYRDCRNPRKSIFSGIVFCATCGRAMCTNGTIHKGEREKYWHLSCLNTSTTAKEKCPTMTRIKYDLLCETVTRELKDLLTLTDEKKKQIVDRALMSSQSSLIERDMERKAKDAEQRLVEIQKVTGRIYEDMYLERISREQAMTLLENYAAESQKLESQRDSFRRQNELSKDREEQFTKFFALLTEITEFDVLNRELVLRLIDRIEVGPKVFKDGLKHGSRSNAPFSHTIRIYYKFVGEI